MYYHIYVFSHIEMPKNFLSIHPFIIVWEMAYI